MKKITAGRRRTVRTSQSTNVVQEPVTMSKKTNGKSHEEPATEQVQPTSGDQSITLTLHGTQKNGLTSYNRDGVRSSVYFGKGMFAGAAPATITITGSGFAAPGAATVVETDPEKLAAQRTKVEAQLAKVEAADKKRAERAAKLRAQLNKLGVGSASTDAPVEM